jgi:hypothetical protein
MKKLVLACMVWASCTFHATAQTFEIPRPLLAYGEIGRVYFDIPGEGFFERLLVGCTDLPSAYGRRLCLRKFAEVMRACVKLSSSTLDLYITLRNKRSQHGRYWPKEKAQLRTLHRWQKTLKSRTKRFLDAYPHMRLALFRRWT